MDETLHWTFAGLAVLFSVWMAIILSRYLRYRRLAPTAVLTWRPDRPWYFGLCVGIGFFMWVLAAASAFLLHRPPLIVLSETLMAVFYTAVFPLAFTIRRGFYRDGIWTERSYVPYRNIRWLGWKESPDIVLAMRSQGRLRGHRYAFLRVRGETYGQARRILADALRSQSLDLETSVLGLDEESPIQERV